MDCWMDEFLNHGVEGRGPTGGLICRTHPKIQDSNTPRVER